MELTRRDFNRLAVGAVNAAVLNFTRALSREAAAEGVRVNAVVPGVTETERFRGLVKHTAAERGIGPGDWVRLETPEGSVRARAVFNATLDPQVVCGQHGWWQACAEISAPGYDPFSPDGANFNLIIGNQAIDPISGSVPHRAYLCQIRLAD